MATKFSRKLLLTTAAAGFLLEAAPAMAQLDEIIVVARKREESILKVPVTATAISGDTLDQYAIGNVKGIADRVPGLNVGTQVLSAGAQVSLRGVGTSTLNPTIDQSVALVVDGMQMTQGIAFNAASFDMAQAEVLKGPQALFYGKAAPAGVIAITTADPTDEFEVILRGGYEFVAEEKLGELVVSGPVTDTLGLRLATQYSDMKGFFENIAVPASHPVVGSLGGTAPTSRDYPNKDTLLIRGTALWEPDDRFSARLKVNFENTEDEGTGGGPQLASCPDGTNSPIAGLAGTILFGAPIHLIGGDDCKLDDKRFTVALDPAAFPGIKNGGMPYTKYEQIFGSLELNYEIREDLTLTSLTGLYDVDHESMINAQATTQYGPPFAAQVGLSRKDFTQEVRLTSDFSGPLNFMIGGFYHDGQMEFWTDLPFNQTWTAFGFPPFLKLGAANHIIDVKAKSLFGQGLWDITPELELGAGVRWTEEDRSHAVDTVGPPGIGPLMPVTVGKPEIGSSNWSPEVSLTYTPTDDLTLFGNFKQAYKSGSFNSAGIPAPGENTEFGDERVRGGEAGIKSRWFNGNLAFNASGYYYKFKGLQVDASIFDAQTNQLITSTVNAAAAKVYGAEFDVAYTPPEVEGLTLFGALNWNKGEYEKFDNAECWGGQTIAQGCNQLFSATANGGLGGFTAQDLAGEPLVRAPEWTANFGFDYERPVLNDLTLRLGSNTVYSSSYSTNLENRADAYQDGYIKTSASASLSGPDEGWMVELIGDNLTDKIVTGNCGFNAYADTQFLTNTFTGSTLTGLSGVDEIACNPERGRSVWVRLTLRPVKLLNR